MYDTFGLQIISEGTGKVVEGVGVTDEGLGASIELVEPVDPVVDAALNSHLGVIPLKS